VAHVGRVDKEVPPVNRARLFCPVVCPLEDRVALSLSLSGLLHSVLPFLPASTPHVETATQKAAAIARHQKHQLLVAARREARLLHIEAIRAEAAAHPRVVIA
jgi:hypothetical protein